MKKIHNKPPIGAAYTWQTKDLKCSAAWRLAGINVRRLIDFLEIEWMRRGGQTNGDLLAPRRQLEAWGMPARCVSDAIGDAISLGLIDCIPGVGRRPSRYSLTWYPLRDGTPATNRWRNTLDETLPEHGETIAKQGSTKCSHKANARVAQVKSQRGESEVTKPVATSEVQAQDPKTRVAEVKHPLRVSYQEGEYTLSIREGEGGTPRPSVVHALAGRRLQARAA